LFYDASLSEKEAKLEFSNYRTVGVFQPQIGGYHGWSTSTVQRRNGREKSLFGFVKVLHQYTLIVTENSLSVKGYFLWLIGGDFLEGFFCRKMMRNDFKKK